MSNVLISWSTGKDSAYALYELQRLYPIGQLELLTTVTMPFDRVSIHGVRRELLRAQASRMNLPLSVVEIPHPCSAEQYDALMQGFLTTKLSQQGISQIAFGDLFLEEIRHYRETKLASTSIQPLFPLWRRETKTLAHEIIEKGFKGIVTCVDKKYLDCSFVGRIFDHHFLQDLPDHVDPCGENGEFHTFVFDGPIFKKPLEVEKGEIVTRENYCFLDLKLKEKSI